MSRGRVVHDADGLNTGAHPAVMAENFITPVEHFFTRSHAPVPLLDGAAWRLQVGGLVRHEASFTLERLQRDFPSATVAASLVCAGLRRAELLAEAPLPGELPWGVEPAGTGEWTGVRLRDLLAVAVPTPAATEVEFTGLDAVEREGKRFGFGGSIALSKALEEDVLVAWALNGAPLTPAHGYPARSIVPGWIGARSVKWLGRITLRDSPSENYFQQRAYRFQRPVPGGKARDVSAGEALTGVPLNAVILEPGDGEPAGPGPLRVRGWAMGPAGRALASVELSPDGGATWVTPRITGAARRWTWAFWEVELALPPGRHTLVARATAEGGETQPARVSDTWNVKGYANNAWHRVEVVVA